MVNQWPRQDRGGSWKGEKVVFSLSLQGVFISGTTGGREKKS